MRYKSKYERFDDVILDVNKKLSLGIITPLNLAEEYKRFDSDERYEPQFVYPKLRLDYDSCLSQLRSLSFDSEPLDQLYKEKADELHNFLMMFKFRGKSMFTRYSQRIYGAPDAQLLVYARDLLRHDPHKIFDSRSVVSTKEAVRTFRRALSKLGFDWEVKAANIVSDASVVPIERKLLVRNNAKFSMKQIRRFIAHEIYTHILRGECGLLQPYKIFRAGLAGYEATEEGLALYKERVAGVLDARTLRNYAGRVIAVQSALGRSFRNTYNVLTKYYPKQQAWSLAVRVKRWLDDTSQPGAFTKDLIYLKGYQAVSQFVKNRSCLHLLHYGKIAVKHALKIPQIAGLRDPNELRHRRSKAGVFGDLFW